MATNAASACRKEAKGAEPDFKKIKKQPHFQKDSRNLRRRRKKKKKSAHGVTFHNGFGRETHKRIPNKNTRSPPTNSKRFRTFSSAGEVRGLLSELMNRRW
ncbi:hypothetical protein E2320_004052 [Naja naja]|nr:hypothetical protein E2320_004052 [Naja naja]